MASYYTEQQSLDVTEGLARRAQSGLFVGLTPYGYNNQRVDGRSIVIINDRAAENVKIIYDLYAFKNMTVDGIVEHLTKQQIAYLPARPAWNRSKVHTILHDRCYIGELCYRGQWLAGTHTPLIHRSVWDRVQTLLGRGKTYRAHELVYAGGLITCGHCGNVITGERVTKPSGKSYVYYRCSMYNLKDHPRHRVSEADLDRQFQAIFERIRQPDDVGQWFGNQLQRWCREQQKTVLTETSTLQHDMSVLRDQQDRL